MLTPVFFRYTRRKPRSLSFLSRARKQAVLTLTILVLPLAAQVGGRAARPKVQRPDGPVWDIIRKNCTECHGIDDYAFFALDKAGWQKLIATKHKGTGVSLSDSDMGQLTDWLVSKFGPDSKPFPRTYVPPEITTFFSDPEAYRLMNRACTKCHGIDRVQGARKAEEGWRVTLVDMRERGALISDQELEQLVEWLTRVWGTNQDK
jgi:mono/diheme cytochrome c family protein